MLPSWMVLDPLIRSWLLEDIGRGDRTTMGITPKLSQVGKAEWLFKEKGVAAGLTIAGRVFQLIDSQVMFTATVDEGVWSDRGQITAYIHGPMETLLTGERVALNLAMRLSGIATMARRYVEQISDLPAQLVDTRKTTPGLRILEKYASWVGGAINHRMGLDDGVMIKDNHIAAAGGIGEAITLVRARVPYPLTIEVEAATLTQVQAALTHGADIIMLDNMPIAEMTTAVTVIRDFDDRVKIEASGNITLDTIRSVAQTGVDYISTSAPITRSPWLDISMRVSGS
ncbi:MAG: carboxylating nicotinate-nucleotide diphosphorylase [Cyanobacteria bacterium P01_A01_bin.123]